MRVSQCEVVPRRVIDTMKNSDINHSSGTDMLRFIAVAVLFAASITLTACGGGEDELPIEGQASQARIADLSADS